MKLLHHIFSQGFCAVALLTITFTLLAQDKSTTIRGDTESPTVLYLVPWQQTPSVQGNTDFDMELDFEFQPLSRSEVIREVRYYKQIDYDKNVKTTVNKDLRVIQR